MLRLRWPLLALALIGCSPAPPTIAPSTPVPTGTPEVIYTMQIEATLDPPATVLVSGSTNLPEGALITLSASRVFQLRDEDTRTSNVGRWQQVPVTGGRFSGTLALDESNIGLLRGDQYYIDTLDADLAVCAELKTGNDFGGRPRQPESVAAIIGPNGEALATSPQLSVFGDWTDPPSNWLYVVVDLPLEPLTLDQIVSQQGAAPEVVSLRGYCARESGDLDFR